MADKTPPSSAGDDNHRPMCKFFKQGFCRNGTACRFGHAGSPQTVCRFYQQRNCRYGDCCRFRHDDQNPVKKQEEEKEDEVKVKDEREEEESEGEDEMEESEMSLMLERMKRIGLMSAEERAADLEQRMLNGGCNDEEAEELFEYGIMPYESDAERVLAYLHHGWQNEFSGGFDGYVSWDSNDYDDDHFWGSDEDVDEDEDEEKEDKQASEDTGADAADDS